VRKRKAGKRESEDEGKEMTRKEEGIMGYIFFTF